MSLRKFKRRKKERQRRDMKEDPVSLFNLANHEFDRGNRTAAIVAYRKALRLRPDYVEAMDNLAVVLHEEGEPEASVDLLRRSLRLNLKNPVAANNLAASLLALGHCREARESCRAALALAPDYVEAHNNLGTILMAIGDKSGSEAGFRKALALDPRNASAWRHLVLCRHYLSVDDPDMAAIALALGKTIAGSLDEMLLRFAAGKICDDCGSYDQAFAFFARANEIRRSFCRYNRDDYQRMVDRIIATFSPVFFSAGDRSGGEKREQPVFIIGMPRSGSSLVEQVLASHPQVVGVGENRQINRLIERLSLRRGGMPYPDCVPAVDPGLLADLTGDYLEWLRAEAGLDNPLRITDKTLTNHLHVGLLMYLFPGARFIHCKRDPRDIAISLFSLYMPEVIYGGSLEDIAFVCREEHRLMEHWFALDRGVNNRPRIMSVSYEDMVRDPAKESRRIIDFLALPWDDACLDFHANKRPVNTASAWQVRRPVYRTSLGRWKNYEKHLLASS